MILFLLACAGENQIAFCKETCSKANLDYQETMPTIREGTFHCICSKTFEAVPKISEKSPEWSSTNMEF